MNAAKKSSKGPRRRDPERTRAQLLSAAREVFVEHGFTGARTSAIAQKAGVPQGLIYHYFESKEGLFDAVMEEVFSPYFARMHEMLGAADEPDLRLLENSVRFYFHFLRENPHVPRLLAWWMADQGWEDKPLTRKQSEAEAVERLGSQRIAEGQAAGFIRADLDPAFVIKTFIDLCLMWHLSRGNHMLQCSVDPDAEDLDLAYLEHMVEVFFRGIVTEDYRDHPKP